MVLKLCALALPLFIAGDLAWPGYIATSFYRGQLGSLMKSDVTWVAAILFYLVYIAGLVIFVIAPAVTADSWSHALLYGALFGLVTYATYDLTNLATLTGWPVMVTIVDMLWGATLASAVSAATFFLARLI